MTPNELRAAADHLDRLEGLEPRVGRIALADRLRRGARWMEIGNGGARRTPMSDAEFFIEEQKARIQALKDKARAGELREELIQVAAVAVAIVEDLDYGEANFAGARSNRSPKWYRGDDVLLEVANERMAQDRKWGPQHHSPMEWLAILGEEFGEACRAALDDMDQEDPDE